jgi:hypothetical protein
LKDLQLENLMLRSLALWCIALPGLVLTSALDAYAKPCRGAIAVPALEEMLPRARAALDLPGTDQVEVDAASRCIGIQVRSKGTARLVKLVLRGVNVPYGAASITVVEPPTPVGAVRPIPY